MKRSTQVSICIFLLLHIVDFCKADTAPTPVEKAAAIHKGLEFLYNAQQAQGSWATSGNVQAETGAVVFAFLAQQDQWGASKAKYQTAVDKGVGYLLQSATVIALDSRPDGLSVCPKPDTSCKGVFWYGISNPIYTTSFVAPALALYGQIAGGPTVAATTGPLAGLTWSDIAQLITNALAANQSTRGAGEREGGWGPYIPTNNDSDSLSTESAIIALIYDETLGAVTPAAVKDQIKTWLSKVQSASGAACLQPGSVQCDQATTGGWLLGAKFTGFDVDNLQVQAALNFLNATWQAPASGLSAGNFGQPSAMLAIYRGLEATIGISDSSHINNLVSDCGARRRPGARPADTVSCGWSTDYATWLVKTQKADGSWRGYSYWTDPLTAAFYLHILSATHIPIQKPQSLEMSPVERSKIPIQIVERPITNSVRSQVAPSAGAPGQTRSRARKGITALDVKPDGSALATASTDNKVRIWSAASGLQALVLEGLASLPTGLAFSTDGATVNSVGRDSLLRIWDAANGSSLASLAAHAQGIRAVAVSPDGKSLASVGEETRIILWDRAGRKLSKVLYGATDFVNAVSFSPDSRLLASAGDDARVLLFDALSGNLLFTLLGHAGPIDSVAFHPDGSILASAGQDTVIHLWDPIKGQQRQALSGHLAPIRTLAFSPDGKLLASGAEDTQIILWNTAAGTIEKILSGATGSINALVFDPKGRFLASASEAGELILWSVATGTKLLTITVPTGP